MKYNAIPDTITKNCWRAEAIGKDGEVYQALFIGPDCAARCWQYVEWMNRDKGAIT